MANSKDNLSKYGKCFIGFDEPSGNAMDSIGGWTGTLTNAPVRVAGWNGKGYAMSFNGTNQYVQFNNSIIPIGAKSIRFKIKIDTAPILSYRILHSLTPSDYQGFIAQIGVNGYPIFSQYDGGSAVETRTLHAVAEKNVCDSQWHDILFTWDGTTNENGIKVFIDDMLNPVFTTKAMKTANVTNWTNLSVGGVGVETDYKLNGQLDSIEIYDRVISPIPDKYLVQHNSQYKYHDGTAWKTTTATEANFKQYGMSQLSQITEAQWQELVGAKFLAMWSDFEDKQWANAVLNIEPVTVNELLGDNPEVVYYTDSGTSHIVVETEVEPFSVYDYISDLPTVVAYTETTEDIIVSTTTDPFTIYDEFGDSVDVLYYTDDTAVTEADLILEANWSPVDELNGDFEVVTWTDEEGANKTLEMTALPTPKFVFNVANMLQLENAISAIKSSDHSTYINNSTARVLLSNDNTNWFTWNGVSFESIVLEDAIILEKGITIDSLNSLTKDDLIKWEHGKVNVGVFLADDIRDNVIAKVGNVDVTTSLPSNASTVEDVSLYILNTTARINIDLSGLSLTGQVTDDDMTRVQYRVKLNGVPYYPNNGDFTSLSNPPLNIDITIRSEDIKIGDWNTIDVEFQDYFGSSDTWSAQFIGKYAGIMFTDPEGNYYSSDVGQVLKYLDFGEILTGQVTPYYEVKLKNEYGFDVRDASLTVNTNNFPEGLRVELSTTNNEVGDKVLPVGSLADGQEFTFYVRMRSAMNTIPNGNRNFDIVVLAIRDV